MSWQKSARALIGEFGEDAVKWLRSFLPADSSVAEARKTLARPSLAVQRALPAPPKVLALPAPKPKPKGKPRGGQFYPDTSLAARDARAAGYKVRDRGESADTGMRYQVVRPGGEGSVAHGSQPEFAWRLAEQEQARNIARSNLSPEAAARAAREDASLIDWVPEGEVAAGPGPGARLGDWLEKTLAKYYKTDFGTEADPLRDLAARGLHFDPEMTPERWLDTANSSLMEDPIGYFTVPRHESNIRAELGAAPDDLGAQLGGLTFYGASDPIAQGALMQAAPWLRKQPVTDMLYGIRSPLDLGHFTDEMRNAMNAAESGLPADLAVRPEMLERMSFPQAVERVGRINQFRVKQMEAEQANILNNPAVQMFKEYPDDPRGMRWVEMRAPEPNEGLLDETDRALLGMGASPEALNQRYAELQRQKLQEALRNEGDVMGHCVGGYCDDVLQGKSRIFSLRDAKGQPHVTVETAPRAQLYRDVVRAVGDAQASAWLDEGVPLADMVQRAQIERPQDIVQIKGKQNRAPNPEYLPFVQDFVKSGQWGEIGDFGNTGLVRLPDRRMITQQQLEQAQSSPLALDLFKDPEQARKNLQQWNINTFSPEDWEQTKHLFEGFARGGLAVKKCGCTQCGGLAVRKAA